MSTRYFEDVKIGDAIEYGSKTLTKDEIINFAKKYDPQPFHVDEAAAKETIYGGIIASGWHTAAVTMRMMVDNMIDTKASLGSPGIDNLRWHKPVFPGDTLRVRSEVTDKRRSKSRPTMGTTFGKLEVFNQNDELVMSFNSIGMMLARSSED